MTTFRSFACTALFSAAWIGLSGCGGARPAEPAAAPSVEVPAGKTQTQYPQAPAAEGAAPAAEAPATNAAPPPAAAPMPVAPTAPPRDEDNSMGAEVAREIRKQEQEIAAGNCPTACRALASMERAVSFLCATKTNDDDADRCADAKRRLGAARRRVRATCGACPGGPSLEQDAPLPSR